MCLGITNTHTFSFEGTVYTLAFQKCGNHGSYATIKEIVTKYTTDMAEAAEMLHKHNKEKKLLMFASTTLVLENWEKDTIGKSVDTINQLIGKISGKINDQ